MKKAKSKVMAGMKKFVKGKMAAKGKKGAAKK